MNKIFRLLSLVFLLVLAGCTTVKRYSSARIAGDDQSLVSVNLFGYNLYPDKPDSPRRSLWDLNATAQANLLDILNKRYPDNEWFINSLNNNYLESVIDGERITDFSTMNLKLVLSVSRKRDYSKIGKSPSSGTPAADRIEYLKIRITLPDSLNVSFTNWENYRTEYADIEIANVSFNRSFNAGGEAEAGVTGEPLKTSASLSANGGLSMKEDQKIRYRYLKFNGKIDAKCLELEEEGTRETDLTGNIEADITICMGNFRERVYIPTIIEQSGKLPLMTLQGIDITLPDLNNSAGPVIADMTYEYLYRHVTRGSKTFQEWDDHVEYYTGSNSKRITLFKSEDYLPPLHIIANGNNYDGKMMIKTADGRWFSLKFMSYNEALIFCDWLKRLPELTDSDNKPVTVSGSTLYLNGEVLTPSRIKSYTDLKVLRYYQGSKAS